MLFRLSLALAATLLPAAAGTNWLTDLPKAQAQAKAEGKPVLVNFTGSDWCGWCIRLRKEVFSSPDFNTYADKNLLLVEVDFPKRKAQPPALRQANEALSANYRVEGYPTLVLLDSSGTQLGRLGYEPGGPRPFLAQLAKLTGRQPEPAPVAAMKKAESTHRAAVAKRGEGATPADELPAFNGAPIVPPPAYTELILKGISGPKSRRMAKINNETLSAGESAAVKLGGKQVKVRCVAVHEKSVLVAVEGEAQQREIRLRQGL